MNLRIDNQKETKNTYIIQHARLMLVCRGVLPRHHQLVTHISNEHAYLGHLGGRIVGGLLEDVPLLIGLGISTELLYAGAGTRFLHGLSAGVVVFHTSFLVSVAAQEGLLTGIPFYLYYNIHETSGLHRLVVES